MPPPEPSLTRPPAWEAAALIGGGVALVVALVVAGRWLSEGTGARLSIVDPGRPRASALTDPYAGSKVCGECHPGESALYSRSGHSRTLQPAAASPAARKIAGRTVADPEQPGVSWSYSVRDGVLQARRSERGAVERFVLDYVLGSGHHAATFVTVTDPWGPAAVEHRLTYYTGPDALEVTPGQRADQRIEGTTRTGREMGPRDTRKCFGCHATPVSADEAFATAPGQAPVPAPGPMLPNVTCERCHGPARAHVEAARRGRGDLSLPFGFDGGTAEAQLGLCGQCHRHPARFPASRVRPDDPELVRFQPIGLMQSKCFTASAGVLRCTTCHDPHARASADRAGYETVCLSCHGPSSKPAAGRACPVSPKAGCLDCHMPKVDSGQRILFTDHWIRVRDPVATR
jgi:hypothetical protein